MIILVDIERLMTSRDMELIEAAEAAWRAPDRVTGF